MVVCAAAGVVGVVEQLCGRAAGQAHGFACEVRLVGVSRLAGEARETYRCCPFCAGEGEEALEPKHALEHLRRHSDRGLASATKLALRDVEGDRKGVHAALAVQQGVRCSDRDRVGR